jgi:NhaA family Na+:H+ antiporter
VSDQRTERRWSSLADFLHDEAAGGAVLLVATAVALVWVNSPWGHSYEDLWHHQLTVGWGEHAVTLSLQHWVNDGLMALFFFVVGLEIKRELVVGELQQPRTAMLPIVAACAGAALPALIYLAIVPAGEARHGWGVPMATDIAFAVGVLALVGSRVSQGAKLFLLSIAIVDDLIAIVVIAVVYTQSLRLGWDVVAIGGLLVVVVMRRFFTSPWWYVLPALFVWYATLQSGVHATLAGVALGLITPARPVRGRPVLDELTHRLHPVSAFVVVPVFALANAGVLLDKDSLHAALTGRVAWAIVVGLVVGKTLGITGAAWLFVRAGWASLPGDMRRAEVLPVAALGGIGFTVALFIAELAFGDPVLVADAKIGILLASALASLLGAALLWRAVRGRT